MIAEFIFWFLIGLLAYSYFIFPGLMRIIGKSTRVRVKEDLFPKVSVIVSAYNEQLHIGEKIRNIISCNYPADKLEIIIGSDGSTDKTREVIESFTHEFPGLIPLYFEDRRGKSAVLNDCVEAAHGEILILSDAKATFDKEMIRNIVRNFADPGIGIAGATIINNNAGCRGIAHQESTFMSEEIKVKILEGNAFGCTIGVYGACYAIRRELFPGVPCHFAVDDFYISMKVLDAGFKVILDQESKCFENVTSRITEEFRRKVRIGVGNIQNLSTFIPMLLRFNAISFCFFSHKVIRWMGPFFLLIMLSLSFILWENGLIYKILLMIQLFSILASIADFYLKKINLQIILLRFITHFYTMNLALLIGFIKYLIGVKANVWEPTNR